MSYKVQFVGLVCFYRERGSRLALLPDGRNPGSGIEPHYASIVVHPDSVEQTAGWEGVKLEELGVFPLTPCDVLIEGATAAGTLDVSGHEGLPQLRQIDPDFEIDPDRAETIARVPIKQGKLKSYRMPDGTAVISELEVEHQGSVEITVQQKDGRQRSIRVKPGTEIAIANTARGSVYQRGERHNGHFRIYEKLSVRPVALTEPVEQNEAVRPPELKGSTNPLFCGRGPIGLYINCSNTGCC